MRIPATFLPRVVRRFCLIAILPLAPTDFRGQIVPQHQSTLPASPEVKCELRSVGGQQECYLGEVIPIELLFTSSSPKR
jgi:hypothetical protein